MSIAPPFNEDDPHYQAVLRSLLPPLPLEGLPFVTPTQSMLRRSVALPLCPQSYDFGPSTWPSTLAYAPRLNHQIYASVQPQWARGTTPFGPPTPALNDQASKNQQISSTNGCSCETQRVKDEDGMLVCGIDGCTYSYVRSYSLHKHRNSVHYSKLPHKCEFCASATKKRGGFLKYSELVRHVAQKHRESSFKLLQSHRSAHHRRPCKRQGSPDKVSS